MIGGKDQIFTPQAVATALALAASRRPALVADFAAGEGALLAASAKRWPQARHVALDIDADVVTALQAAHPTWEAHHGDFLAPPTAIAALAGAVDLVLLNPPFSCRGNARVAAALGAEQVRCSRAMAFVSQALGFLAAQGELVAIVPASCLTSAKDAEARNAIGRAYKVEILEANQGSVFEGRAVAVAQIRISRRKGAPNAWAAPRPRASVRRLHAPYRVVVARGATGVHTVAPDAQGAPFIHTTDLRDGAWSPAGRHATRPAEIIAGETALLVPRVGRPDVGKLTLVEGPAVLSDCLFRLRTEPAGHEAALRQVLIDAWEGLAALYGGSCAPYATLADLTAFLARLGFGAAVETRVRPGGSPQSTARSPATPALWRAAAQRRNS